MENISEMIFDIRNYEDVCDLMRDASQVMRVLIANDYTVIFEYEDCGFYRMRWVSEMLEDRMIAFLTEDECRCLTEFRSNLGGKDNK